MNESPQSGRATLPRLHRRLSTPMLVLYGLGNILGAGIYLLVGKVAGSAQLAAPLSFVLSAAVASLTALSYAELSARYPVSAGEAIYLQEGFSRPWLAIAAGLLIAFGGTVSAAAVSLGFAGYLGVFVDAPASLVLPLLLAVLGGIAAWGIAQAVWVAGVMTVVEACGLLLVIFAGHEVLAALPAALPQMLTPGLAAWPGVIAGAFLAFYAFLGFEDMVNVAEEVRTPQTTMPRAIILALIISTLLYAGIATVAVLAVEPSRLAASEAPLALIYTETTGRDPALIGLISLMAMVNGVLIQVIMVSRILFGMSRRGWLPAVLGTIHPHTRTPLVATAIVVLAVLTFAFVLPVVTLASLTSLSLLAVFAAVNLSLVRIRRKTPVAPGVRVVPAWIPWLGAASSAALLAAGISG